MPASKLRLDGAGWVNIWLSFPFVVSIQWSMRFLRHNLRFLR